LASLSDGMETKIGGRQDMSGVCHITPLYGGEVHRYSDPTEHKRTTTIVGISMLV